MTATPTPPATPPAAPVPGRLPPDSPLDAAPILAGGIVVRFLVAREQTRGGLAMFEFDVPVGGMAPGAHSHDAYEETLYALRGRLTWTVGGDRFELAPGECVVIPRGVVHRFDNLGEETATTLAVITPGVLGPEYFRDIAAVIAAARGGPPDRAAVAEAMRRPGLTPAERGGRPPRWRSSAKYTGR
jgi:quercetin dioxygenase-like cupin family protein